MPAESLSGPLVQVSNYNHIDYTVEMPTKKETKKSTGKLFIVGTPIGNLEDITLRALRVLKEVDLIACEDTRVTRKLLNRYEITTSTLSYHKFNERQRSREIVQRLQRGLTVALVTNAGMPSVSDPGFILVKDALDQDIPVEIIPGPSAVSAAVALSGIDCASFLFVGFAPQKPAQRLKFLVQLKYERHALVLFESAARIRQTLKDIGRIFGERPIAVMKELTKIHEKIVRGTAAEIIKKLGASARGEFVIVISPHSGEEDWGGIEPVEHIRWLVQELGINEKEALKLVVKMRKLDRAETYRNLIVKKTKKE